MSKQQGGFINGIMNNKIDMVNQLADEKITKVDCIINNKFITLCRLFIAIILLLVILINSIHTLIHKFNQKFLIKDEEK